MYQIRTTKPLTLKESHVLNLLPHTYHSPEDVMKVLELISRCEKEELVRQKEIGDEKQKGKEFPEFKEKLKKTMGPSCYESTIHNVAHRAKITQCSHMGYAIYWTSFTELNGTRVSSNKYVQFVYAVELEKNGQIKYDEGARVISDIEKRESKQACDEICSMLGFGK